MFSPAHYLNRSGDLITAIRLYEPVTNTVNAGQVSRVLWIGFQLLAQMPNKNMDVLGPVLEIRSPDVDKQLLKRTDLA
jgi:hypothetical protein